MSEWLYFFLLEQSVACNCMLASIRGTASQITSFRYQVIATSDVFVSSTAVVARHVMMLFMRLSGRDRQGGK